MARRLLLEQLLLQRLGSCVLGHGQMACFFQGLLHGMQTCLQGVPLQFALLRHQLGARLLGCCLALQLAQRTPGVFETLLKLVRLTVRLTQLGLPRLTVFARPIDLAMRAFFHTTDIGFLRHTGVFGMLLSSQQFLLQCLHLFLPCNACGLQLSALLLQIIDLCQALCQQLLQVDQPSFGHLPRARRLGSMLTGLGGVLSRLVLLNHQLLALLGQHLALTLHRLLDRCLGHCRGVLPKRHERLRHVGGQARQPDFTAQASGQLLPPMVEQAAHPGGTAPPQFQADTLDGRPFAARQHCICRCKHFLFRYAYRHAQCSAILGLIIKDYPTLKIQILKYDTFNVMKNTYELISVDQKPLDLHFLADNTQQAAAAFIEAGTAANTVRSYRSALAYWSAWLKLRYGQVLGDAALPGAVALQFVLDHLARPLADDGWDHLLPEEVDSALVAARVKSRTGPLAYSTVQHRLAVLGKWHRVKGWESPTDTAALKTLLRNAQKAQARHGITVRKKTAMALEPLQAMLATCTDGVRGVRDRALLLLAWSGGGRRRSEVVALQVGDVRRLDADTWVYSLGTTKTDTGGMRREKPLRGPAAHALAAWLAAAPATTGPLFRRLYRGDKVAAQALGGDQVARIVKRRAQMAGLDGDWAAHSLRSGFVTEAGRQGVPLGDVMAMTEHRSVATVMGYFQAGSLLGSKATELLKIDE